MMSKRTAKNSDNLPQTISPTNNDCPTRDGSLDQDQAKALLAFVSQLPDSNDEFAIRNSLVRNPAGASSNVRRGRRRNAQKEES